MHVLLPSDPRSTPANTDKRHMRSETRFSSLDRQQSSRPFDGLGIVSFSRLSRCSYPRLVDGEEGEDG
jgi:hypothetical protein